MEVRLVKVLKDLPKFLHELRRVLCLGIVQEVLHVIVADFHLVIGQVGLCCQMGDYYVSCDDNLLLHLEHFLDSRFSLPSSKVDLLIGPLWNVERLPSRSLGAIPSDVEQLEFEFEADVRQYDHLDH